MNDPIHPLGAPSPKFQFQQIPVGFGRQTFDFGDGAHADYFRPGLFSALTGQSSQGFGNPSTVALLCIGDQLVPTAEPDLPIAPNGYYWRIESGRWVADLWPIDGMPRATATRFIEPYCGGFTTAHVIGGDSDQPPHGVSSMLPRVRPLHAVVGAPEDAQLVTKKEQDAALKALYDHQALSTLADTAKWAAKKVFAGDKIDGWNVAKAVAPALSAIDPELGQAAQFAVPFLQGLFGDKACDYKNAPLCTDVAQYHAPRWDGEDVFDGACCRVEPGGLSVLVSEHAFDYKKWPGYLERLRAADYYVMDCSERQAYTPAGLPPYCGGISNNNISSVIVPKGWIVQFFDRQGLNGKDLVLEEGAYDLHKMDWGDRIRSARVRGPWSLHDYNIGVNLAERKPGWITAGMPQPPSRDLVISLILADPRRPQPSLDLEIPPAQYTSSYGPGWQSNPGIPQLFMRLQDSLAQQQPAAQARMSIDRPNVVGVRPLAKKPTALDIPPAYRSDVSGPADSTDCIEVGALRCRGAQAVNDASRQAADFMRAHGVCGSTVPDGCADGSYVVRVNLARRIPDTLLGNLPKVINGISIQWGWPRGPVEWANLSGPDAFDEPTCSDGNMPRMNELGTLECDLTMRRRAYRPRSR